MFKALDRESGREIIILSPEWADRIDHLRRLDHEDRLVCQGCQQPVRVRAGQHVRRHFAHKHLLDCDYGRESPELLNTRAVLYKWLVGKFGDAATVEKRLDVAGLTRPVDCWVEHKGRFLAYWIVDRRVRSSKMHEVCEALEGTGAAATWVLVATLLREDVDAAGAVYLSTTERELIRPTPYDDLVRLGGGGGGTLHYLDPDDETLTTYRGLWLAHDPQMYQGRRLLDGLAAVQVSPATGGFVHPGEHERLLRRTSRQSEPQARHAWRLAGPAALAEQGQRAEVVLPEMTAGITTQPSQCPQAGTPR